MSNVAMDALDVIESSVAWRLQKFRDEQEKKNRKG